MRRGCWPLRTTQTGNSTGVKFRSSSSSSRFSVVSVEPRRPVGVKPPPHYSRPRPCRLSFASSNQRTRRLRPNYNPLGYAEYKAPIVHHRSLPAASDAVHDYDMCLIKKLVDSPTPHKVQTSAATRIPARSSSLILHPGSRHGFEPTGVDDIPGVGLLVYCYPF